MWRFNFFLPLFITLILSLQVNEVPGQSRYLIHLGEEVLSDYDNLLDTVSTRNYRLTQRQYQAEAYVKKINDSTSFVKLAIDSTGGKVKQYELVSFIYKTSHADPLNAVIYFSTTPPLPVQYLVKNIISNIPFLTPAVKEKTWRKEPYLEGVYHAGYQSSPQLDSAGKDVKIIIKEKHSFYLPGINSFINAIDSFSCTLKYNSTNNMLISAVLFETKHQRMGSRVLARIITRISIQQDNSIQLSAENGTALNQFGAPVPVFKESGYTDRIKRVAQNNYRNIPTAMLLKELNAVTEKNAHRISAVIRLGLVNQSIPLSWVQSIMDTANSSSLLFRVVEDALVEAGTNDTQDLLADILHTNTQLSFRKRLIVKLGVTAPLCSRKLLQQLFSIKKSSPDASLAAATGLALANNAWLLEKEQQKTIRDSILYFLENCFLRSEKKRSDTIQWLLESGNAGNSHILPLIETCIANKTADEEIYKEALYSLRFIAGEKTDSLLALQLSEMNKQEADWLADILRLRYPALLIRQSVYRYLQRKNGSADQVAKKLTGYLLSWKEEVPGLMEELKQLQTH